MVNWTAEKDLTILLTILEVNNIPLGGKLLDAIAAKIGEGCTPKAVSHRIANIKARAKALADNPDTATPTSSPTKGKAKAKATPTPTPKRGRSKKQATVDEEDLQDDDDELAKSPTANKGKKRGRKAASSEEEDFSDMNLKKVKVEDAEVTLANAEDDGEDNEFV